MRQFSLIAILCACASSLVAGVLSVHPDNPLWFANGSGRAVYLGGHQIFVDLQDNSFNKEFIRNRERILGWHEYVEFLKTNNFNYLRNWVIWSTDSGAMASVNNAVAFPMPYKRVEGFGKAKDGKNKFDLNQFDETFFHRMRKRCEDLQGAGVYVSIMLFEVYGFLGGESVGDPPQTLWDGNVFNKANNINGIALQRRLSMPVSWIWQMSPREVTWRQQVSAWQSLDTNMLCINRATSRSRSRACVQGRLMTTNCMMRH